jgi:two-component system, chemotaxis family, sensor kinase CheA
VSNDPYKYFRVEARELWDGLHQGVLALEKRQAPAGTVQRLLRLAHTLKGAARVVKQVAIAELAHSLEDELALHKESGAPGKESIERMLGLLDGVSARISALSAPSAPVAQAPAGPTPGRLVLDEMPRSVRADAVVIDGLLEGIAEVSVQLGAVRRSTEELTRALRLVEMLGSHPSAGARSLLEQLARKLEVATRAISTGVDGSSRELAQVRESAERLRLLPASLMFQTLERAARDASVSLSKPVVFSAEGGEVMLDAVVLGLAQSALLQAVRNAVAHGLESAGARARAGKKPEGVVAVAVRRRGARLVFSCRDDGGGVDLAGLRAAAARQGATLPPDDALALEMLFGAGVSTSSQVTGLAGRGVGLDVVREAAQRLSGSANLRSTPGAGAELELNVPMSLSSLEVLVFRAADQDLALPLEAIGRVLKAAQPEGGSTIVLDGARVPWFSLRACLGAPLADSASPALVLGDDLHRLVVAVDALLGTETVMLRPVPEQAADEAVMGLSLDAEGNPRLVLEPGGLARLGQALTRPGAPTRRKKHEILVVDDSLTTRMLEQSILESAGYAVDLAQSGEEGLEKARAKRYALILVDVEMPGMDGFTFIERAKADPALRDVPAILVTSRAAPEDRARGAAAGASGYVVKTEFDQKDLLDRIARAVG